VDDQHHAPVTLPWERPGSQCTGDHTGLRAGLIEYKYHLTMFNGLHTSKNLVFAGAAPYVLYFTQMQYNSTNKLFIHIFKSLSLRPCMEFCNMLGSYVGKDVSQIECPYFVYCL